MTNNEGSSALHYTIIHVNGQQRVGTHSGQVGPFYEYHLMTFSFGQQNQVSTTKSNNCIIVFKEKKVNFILQFHLPRLYDLG